MLEYDGHIVNLENFIKARLFNHKNWCNILPRAKMRPSDIDAVIDNDGNILQIEAARTAHWHRLAQGQYILQRNYVKICQGKITAALVKIDSYPADLTRDVKEFSVMRWIEGNIIESPVAPGNEWLEFVDKWLYNKLPNQLPRIT